MPKNISSVFAWYGDFDALKNLVTENNIGTIKMDISTAPDVEFLSKVRKQRKKFSNL